MSGISTKNLPLSQNVAEVIGNDSQDNTVRISRETLTRLVGNGIAEQITNAGGMAIFPDTAAGLAATTDGDYFSVPSEDDEEYLILYRNDNGSATEIRRYPSAEAVDHAIEHAEQTTRAAVDLASAPGQLPAEFPYAQPFAFGFTDRDGNILAGIDHEGDWRTKQRAEFPESDLVYAVTDEQGRVLLGFDAEGTLVARGAGGDVRTSGTPMAAYLDGTTLYGVGAREEMLADLGSYAVEALAPGNEKSVRAVIGRPMIGGKRSVSVGRSGLLIPDSDKVLHIVLGLGQSLMVGAGSGDSLINTVAEYPDMVLMPDVGPNSDVRLGLEIYGGGPYNPFDPDDFVGFLPLVAKRGQNTNQGETPLEAFCNVLAREAVAIGVNHRFLAWAPAHGGSSYVALKKGTQVYTNMLLALAKAKVLAEGAGWQVVVDACVVRHGEGDSQNQNYDQDLIEWQQDIDEDVRAVTGQQCPVHFLIAQPSSMEGLNNQSTQKMSEVHDSSPYHHLVGSDYSYSELYHADLLHGTGPFYYLSGEYLARAYQQVVWSSTEKSTVTRMLAAERTGSTVTLTYEVPEPPLVIDTDTVTERDTKGFRYTDSNGEVAINAVSVVDSGVSSGTAIVELELAAAPSGSSETVHYAMNGHASGNDRDITTVARGNIRDSSPLTSSYDGRSLYNWGVHQRIDVVVN